MGPKVTLAARVTDRHGCWHGSMFLEAGPERTAANLSRLEKWVETQSRELAEQDRDQTGTGGKGDSDA